MHDKTFKALVLDMQPIDPPVGGGRLRLLGLYHDLGMHFPTTYIGTYDWPGEKFRDHYLSKTLREINIPLSKEHFAACRKLQKRAGGKNVIDVTFHQLAHLSTDYIEFNKREVSDANIVIFSHPWVFPLLKHEVKASQVIVYDSHNVEGYLRYTLLNDNGVGTDIAREVVKVEYELCHRADFVLVCSQEDGSLYNKLYNLPFEKMGIFPNGVFVSKIKIASDSEKNNARAALGLTGENIAIFIGSNYDPNKAAARFIMNVVAPQLPHVVFVIAGGVGDGLGRNDAPAANNVVITGFLTDEKKLLYLAASDIAVNPMFGGSGTNIKMFDFMAAGLPVISTLIGARGITEKDHAGIVIGAESSFKDKIEEIFRDKARIRDLGQSNRMLAEQEFSWESISPRLGKLLSGLRDEKNKTAMTGPAFQQQNRIAIMGPWKIKCGIAEYTRHLVDALHFQDIDVSMVANTNPDDECLATFDETQTPVQGLWHYDYLKWRDSCLDIDGIIRYLYDRSITKCNIQYHPGFYSAEMLSRLVRRCIFADVEISITLHNSKEMACEVLTELAVLGARLIVHSREEKNQLRDRCAVNAHHIPLGILSLPEQDISTARAELGISQSPVIGSFGFLRPHKGVLELIKAVGILKTAYPKILLLGVNALYPSSDSEVYLKQCQDAVQELGLQDNVRLVTDFLDIEQSIRQLHAADAIVLPYQESSEGASATAGIGMASQRPLIASKSAIFDEIRGFCYTIDEISPSALAREIRHVLTDSELLRQLKIKTGLYREENSWENTAKRYMRVFS